MWEKKRWSFWSGKTLGRGTFWYPLSSSHRRWHREKEEKEAQRWWQLCSCTSRVKQQKGLLTCVTPWNCYKLCISTWKSPHPIPGFSYVCRFVMIRLSEWGGGGGRGDSFCPPSTTSSTPKDVTTHFWRWQCVCVCVELSGAAPHQPL